MQIYVFSLNITKVYRIIMTSTLFFPLPKTKEAKQDSHELTLYMIATLSFEQNIETGLL